LIIRNGVDELNMSETYLGRLKMELTQEENYELVILAVAILVAVVLAYRNREKIKAWCNDITSKFSA
jgi:hypothetical protein